MAHFKAEFGGWLAWGIAVFALASQAIAEPPGPEELRAAIVRGIPLIEASSKEYLRQRECFSCHHQAMPMVMLSEAERRGFAIDKENFQAQLKRTLKHLEGGKKQYAEGNGQGGRVDTAAWALWGLEVGNHPPDETTEAVTHFLLSYQKDQGHWNPPGHRPPTGASRFASTYVALRGLEHYATQDQQPEFRARLEKIADWRKNNSPKDTEDYAYQLRIWNYVKTYAQSGPAIAESDRHGRGYGGYGLRGFRKGLGSWEDRVKWSAEDLLKLQREDGGWAQTDDMESDAYATGTALVALHEAGGIPVSDERYQKGLAYLLKTQEADGSWKVETRSKPIQVYFESGFPHKKGQFVSIAASSWAITAMLYTFPETQVTQK